MKRGLWFLPNERSRMTLARRAQRAAKLDKAAALGFAPKGNEARPRRGGA
jgi:hypothetical protein